MCLPELDVRLARPKKAHHDEQATELHQRLHARREDVLHAPRPARAPGMRAPALHRHLVTEELLHAAGAEPCVDGGVGETDTRRGRAHPEDNAPGPGGLGVGVGVLPLGHAVAERPPENPEAAHRRGVAPRERCRHHEVPKAAEEQKPASARAAKGKGGQTHCTQHCIRDAHHNTQLGQALRTQGCFECLLRKPHAILQRPKCRDVHPGNESMSQTGPQLLITSVHYHGLHRDQLEAKEE
mmetsp:Transcript_23167/g.73358  ORF Transcript_23167/g.73358 Transcript_23167/m.73358 type:complete len:240 (-) Transcript_23167:467-1186(-)